MVLGNSWERVEGSFNCHLVQRDVFEPTFHPLGMKMTFGTRDFILLMNNRVHFSNTIFIYFLLPPL